MDLSRSIPFVKHVNDLMSSWHIPGLGIAVINGSEIFTQGFGHAVLGPQEIEVTFDTLFDCASTSKSFTAAAVSLLIADDKQYPQVQWTPVSHLLPDDFVLPDAYATANATVEDILSDRTGMPGHDYSYLGIKAKDSDTPKSVTRNFRNLPLSKSLRTYQYCNMMFTAATYLVQPSAVHAAGQDYRFAKPYTWRDGKYQDSVANYAKWVRAMMHRLDPISEETYSQLDKPRIVSNPDANEDGDLAPFTSHRLCALGWETEFYRGHKIVRHDGLVSGFGSLILFVPDQRFGIVVFGNAGTANDVSFVLAMELLDLLLGVPEADRVNWAQRAEIDRETDKENEEENKNGTLYIDGTDRSMAFTITLEHVCDDQNFLAHFIDDEGADSPMKAQFRIENANVTALGLALAEELGDSLIWFEKQ
ncbi:hypothetical protein QQZ08_005123 [Neonectria magnoliae]|uniref:Beta-lactamase-related domain-containing protein n=1 Tax=Neonectria magnoliae TaxID=2732573 RepID=A0ABR1I4E7_9HYPO